MYSSALAFLGLHFSRGKLRKQTSRNTVGNRCTKNNKNKITDAQKKIIESSNNFLKKSRDSLGKTLDICEAA